MTTRDGPFRQIARDGGPLPYAPLVHALRERDIATIDLADALGEKARQFSVQDLTSGHYSPLGNRVVAQTLAEQLLRLLVDTCGDR